MPFLIEHGEIGATLMDAFSCFQSLCSKLERKWIFIGAGSLTVVTVAVAVNRYNSITNYKFEVTDEPDSIPSTICSESEHLFHTSSRATTSACLSPPAVCSDPGIVLHTMRYPTWDCLKLETFLKLAGIPFEIVHVEARTGGPKLPWLLHNGKQIVDCDVSIKYISDTFQVDLDHELSSAENAVSHAFQVMLEGNDYWSTACSKWRENISNLPNKIIDDISRNQRWFVKKSIRKKQKDSYWDEELVRHMPSGIRTVTERDFAALSDYLGSKEYIMGEKATYIDCVAFSRLAVHQNDNRQESSTHANLTSYIQRMIKMYFSDRNKCCSFLGEL